MFTNGIDTIHVNPLNVSTAYLKLQDQQQIKLLLVAGGLLGFTATDENMKSYLNLINRLNEL
jgi:hypothetical protein